MSDSYAALFKAIGRFHQGEPAMRDVTEPSPEQSMHKLLRARCPAIVLELVEEVSQIEGITPSEYIRRCVVDCLRDDGAQLSDAEAGLGRDQRRYLAD